MSKRDTDNSLMLKTISRELGRACGRLRFGPPVAMVYNPLDYAARPHNRYLELAGGGPVKVIFLGMNPGPWGMAQTGVPFGDVGMVCDWLGINVAVSGPDNQHTKRPIEGFNCPRSEVSGRRFWGLMSRRFGKPEIFFRDHFVANYCPLAFMDSGGANITPDKLPVYETMPLFEACDNALAQTIKTLKPQWVIGVGAFAKKRIDKVKERFFPDDDYAKAAGNGKRAKIFSTAQILHPSPASPKANSGWDEQVIKTLVGLGIWNEQ